MFLENLVITITQKHFYQQESKKKYFHVRLSYKFHFFSAVKRLLKEAQELHEPTEEYYAQPLDDNLFEWHFTLRGPLSTEFEEGIYHGRIILPSEYPMKPPDIIFITVSFLFP